MRFRVQPGDVPPHAAARRLGLTCAEFDDVLPRLLARGFPQKDPDTGNYDLDAIDQWRKRRYPQLFTLTTTPTALDANDVVSKRIARLRDG
jgi:hypothetical protein